MSTLVEVARYAALGVVGILLVALLEAALWGLVVEAGSAIYRLFELRRAKKLHKKWSAAWPELEEFRRRVESEEYARRVKGE